MKPLKSLILLLALCFSSINFNIMAAETKWTDEKLEAAYQELSKELRCPKCTNQSIADSNSIISDDLRKLVIRLLKENKSDAEIRQFLVDRYGDSILYRPQFQANTMLLWIAPLFFLLIGLGILLYFIKNNRSTKK